MGPETGRKGALAVSLRIEAFLKQLLGKDASLGKSIHATPDFDIDVAVPIHLHSKAILFEKV